MEGRFDFMFLDAAVALAPLKAGKLKALAVTGATRDPTLPDVPPLTDFFPGFDLQPWMSIVGAGRHCPAPVVAAPEWRIEQGARRPRSSSSVCATSALAATPLTRGGFRRFHQT